MTFAAFESAVPKIAAYPPGCRQRLLRRSRQGPIPSSLGRAVAARKSPFDPTDQPQMRSGCVVESLSSILYAMSYTETKGYFMRPPDPGRTRTSSPARAGKGMRPVEVVVRADVDPPRVAPLRHHGANHAVEGQDASTSAIFTEPRCDRTCGGVRSSAKASAVAERPVGALPAIDMTG